MTAWIEKCSWCGASYLEITTDNIFFPRADVPAVNCKECGEMILLDIEDQCGNLLIK